MHNHLESIMQIISSSVSPALMGVVLNGILPDIARMGKCGLIGDGTSVGSQQGKSGDGDIGIGITAR